MHRYVPRPNDFSDFSEYFVRRALISGIAAVRFENGKCPAVVRQFLIDQLKYNDNTANLVSVFLFNLRNNVSLYKVHRRILHLLDYLIPRVY